MASAEDVLLQIPHVKYKKDNGTLYVMTERLAWFQGNQDTMTLSHKYSDIKTQKISPEGKPKIQLQLVLYDNTTFTFHFVNPKGSQAQLDDREQVKTLMMQLLPKFRKQINSELEEKNRLLMQNHSLLKLYKELVQANVITSEEFWANYAEQNMKNSQKAKVSQEVGISSGFLSGIHPETDGANGIRYNLSTDIIESIFKTYPAVKRKHAECVPAEMTESQFWIKFFQSHYYHRDRLPLLRDMFSDCAKADDKVMKRELERIRNSGSELISVLEGSEVSEIQLDREAQSVETQPKSASEVKASKEKDKDKNLTITPQGMHRNMIKRFNQHSILVLKATSNVPPSAAASGSAVDDNKKVVAENGNSGAGTSDKPQPSTSSDSGIPAKLARLEDSLLLEDLKEEETVKYQKLKLTKLDRYLNGPVPSYRTEPINHEQIASIGQVMREQAPRWESVKPKLLDAKTAVKVIEELSPGGNLMKNAHSSNSAQLLTPDVESEIRGIYLALLELLKHFYSCFPVTTPALEEKLKKSQDTITKFEQMKIQPLKDKLLREHLPAQSLLAHIFSVVQAANEKYMQWVQKSQMLSARR